MRVLHWQPSFLAGGAVANSVVDLAVAEARAGAEVVIAAADVHRTHVYGEPKLESATVTTWKQAWVINTFGLQLSGIGRSDRRNLARLNPDLVHIHAEFNPDNLRIPRLFDCPVVLAPRGAFNAPVFAKSRTRGKLAYVWAARQLLYRHVASFHAISPDEAVHVRQLLPGAPVYVAPDPVVDGLPVGTATRQQFDDTVRLIFVGRLDVFTKGLDLLLTAVAVARDELLPTRLELTLVGPDWHDGRRRLEHLARELTLSDALRFEGLVSRPQVDVLLGASDLYVQLSRHEAFGLSIREALLAPLPVIVTEGAGIASFSEIARLPHVITVPPLDTAAAAAAIVAAARRLPELRAHAEHARPSIFNLFSWRNVAALHFAAYSALSQKESAAASGNGPLA